MSLGILRSVVQFTDPSGSRPGAMPAEELRFVIEFASRPDPDSIRTKLAGLLASDKFLLEPLFANAQAPLDRFLLLRIAGAERTLPADVLFEEAYALCAGLGAVSVEPDAGSRFYEEPAPPVAGPRGEAAEAVRRWCNVDTAAPVDFLWAPRTVKAPAAWAADPKQGAGAIVAQPDTGVVPGHAELGGGALDMGLGFNVLDPGEPPVDPLSAGMSNPGHGTGTASCVVSRADGKVTGVAPAARLVPIRCINDVKIFDPAPVARAIDYARRSGCHVITMSLGGVPSRALHAAVKAAVDEHIVLLAAAGNCVGFVVWPARYDECIAVAGINIDDAPWKGSSRGAAVDVSAPAENVWRADPRPDAAAAGAVTAGQGTSFAVAMVAGVAALWLAHHGRAQLIAEARSRGVTVQDLFRSALAMTARRPAAWDAASFGAGVVDAAAVQALNPKEIRFTRKESAAPAPDDNEIADLVAELGGGAPADVPRNFDWARYGMELASVVMERSRRGSRARSGAGTEAGTQAYRPSGTLAASLRGTQAPVLEGVRDGRAEGFVPPQLVLPGRRPGAAGGRASGALQLLARRARGDTREAAGAPLAMHEASGALARDGGKVLDRALERVAQPLAPGVDPGDVRKLADLLQQHGRAAMAALAKDGTEAALDSVQRASLEALIKLTGRPALRVQGDKVNLADPDIGDWKGPLVLIQNLIPGLVKPVGRIDVAGSHVGTGFLIAKDLVMTNRHVLEEIAVPVPAAVKPKKWILAQDGVSIDFRREQGSAETLRFAVTEVVFSGPDPTNDTDFVDFRDLDLAVLRIAAQDSAGKPAPQPLAFLKGEFETHSSKDVLVIGFPARPATLPMDAAGQVRQDVVDALARIYGLRYGVKYLSPGEVSALPGEVEGDPQKWVFSHDATTLGGNSGSCVVRYGPQPAIIGLHFAGDFERANYGHAITRLVGGHHLPPELVEQLTFIEE